MKDEADTFTPDMLCKAHQIANNAFANAALLALFRAGDAMAKELAEHAEEIERVDGPYMAGYLRGMSEAWARAKKAMEDAV